MFSLPETTILFDTEFTAWAGSMARGWNGEGEYKEIVQIGAVRVAFPECREVDSFSVFIRPQKNPILSDWGLPRLDAMRGASEACDQAVWVYTAREQTSEGEKAMGLLFHKQCAKRESPRIISSHSRILLKR